MTREGRRRSSLNRRQLPLPKLGVKLLARLGADPDHFLRVWRDVKLVFEFMPPEMQRSVEESDQLLAELGVLR